MKFKSQASVNNIYGRLNTAKQTVEKVSFQIEDEIWPYVVNGLGTKVIPTCCNWTNLVLTQNIIWPAPWLVFYAHLWE